MSAVTSSHNHSSLIRELERLTRDLRSLNAGAAPFEQQLQASPLLDQWSFGFLPAPCLIGAVYQHPTLGNRPTINTSELIFIDPSRRWARTRSRFYRLGDQRRDDRCADIHADVHS
jgi:hypothetical protein